MTTIPERPNWKMMERQLPMRFALDTMLVPVSALLGTDDGDRLLPLPDRLPFTGLNAVRMTTVNPDVIRRIRLLIGDFEAPYYFTNAQLQEYYDDELKDLHQGAAAACESWASQLSYDEGAFSAGGITVNASSMAADKRQRANELRMKFVSA